MSDALSFTLNGKAVELPSALGDEPLLWVLRDRLGLTGTKFGCGHGGCGACTVEIDGHAIAACTVLAKEVTGKSVTTIEGLAQQADQALIRAWLAEQVPQCGYCQPGMIMAAATLLAAHPRPSDAEIDAALSHVLCRCGTYQRVRRAIHLAAEKNWATAPFPDITTAAPHRDPPLEAIRFNPWIKIARDGTVVVVIGRQEMGQGISTAVPMMAAEELDIPLDRVRFAFAPADHAYDDPIIHRQITVGSLSVQNTWHAVREAGAEVRERLIAAAALRWNAPREECDARDGAVFHRPTGRSLDYGALADAAAALPPVKAPPLKDIDSFRLLGKPTPRLDLPDHVTGRSLFGLDVKFPGLRAATVRLAPNFGATVEAIDSQKALQIPGVRKVISISDGAAIIADDRWSALKGREALDVTWGGGTTISSAAIHQRFRAALDRKGRDLKREGDADRALTGAAQRITAEYETPYLAHAPIEPMNCTARIANGRCEIWVPTQSPQLAREAAARAAGLAPEAVTVHSTFLGGGFGRRSVPDVVAQAVEIAKAAKEPIQLLWTRDDDIRHDHYRPANITRLSAGLDSAGRLAAWSQRIAGPELAGDGVNLPYDIPNLTVDFVEDDPGIPTGYWRSVGASQNAFVIESFIDELACAAKADPVAFRLSLLAKSPRHRAVLERAATLGGWDSPAPAGRARGVALYYAHGGWAAQIAEISIGPDRAIRVHRVTCAADIGFVVNPDIAIAQIEGGIVFGLTAALKDEITIAGGHAVQHGFNDYPLLTIAETPAIEVQLMPSRETPTGAGECGVPPIAPAVANAIFAATGIRLRKLPLKL